MVQFSALSQPGAHMVMVCAAYSFHLKMSYFIAEISMVQAEPIQARSTLVKLYQYWLSPA